jgi:2-oxoglutarate ferredoxin oxidoreductase subunit alpha
MQRNELTFKIGGEAGQGVRSSGAGFAHALARGGLHVFGMQGYMSRIRGGHNFYQLRVAEKPLYCHSDHVHLLIAMIPETIDRHGDEVVAGGAVIYDEGLEVDRKALRKRKVSCFPAPLVKIAEEEGSQVMANTAALGVGAGVTGYDLEPIEGVIRDNFSKKGQKIIDANLRVVQRAYDYGQQRYGGDFDHELKRVKAPPRMVINGNQAICLGALLGGCRFVAAYPMTPATSIIEWMAGHAEEYGLVTKHTEDELAAILMAIGANHMGVRAMVATSGGGFSLMVESLGLAGMTETPVVIVESQRPGPATGMPTRTAQGDLQFVIHASQDEFPRVVLAPGTTEDCFRAGWRAFNLAERMQSPAIILVDSFLSNSVRTIERADLGFEGVRIDRGELLSESELDELPGGYKRYAITETGVSPRALPGHPNGVFQACSDEHDEYGKFEDEDAENRVQMAEKRLRKLEVARKDMRPPELYGPRKADVTLVGWGSSYGPMREVVDRGKSDGGSVNALHFADIWPLPDIEAAESLKAANRLVAVEGNGTGQFARLLRAYTGVQVDGLITRFDGRPFSPEYILARL